MTQSCGSCLIRRGHLASYVKVIVLSNSELIKVQIYAIIDSNAWLRNKQIYFSSPFIEPSIEFCKLAKTRT